MRFPNLTRLFRPDAGGKEDGSNSDIHYASFVSRSFALTLDILLLFLLLSPLFELFSQTLFADFYRNGGEQKASQILVAMLQGSLSSEVAFKQLSQLGLFQKLAIDYSLQILISGVIIVGLWQRYAATPGMWLMRMYVADAEDGGEPRLRQYIIRYLVGIISFVPFMQGMITMLFNKKKMALHDYAAATVVLQHKLKLPFAKKKAKETEPLDKEQEQ